MILEATDFSKGMYIYHTSLNGKNVGKVIQDCRCPGTFRLRRHLCHNGFDESGGGFVDILPARFDEPLVQLRFPSAPLTHGKMACALRL